MIKEEDDWEDIYKNYSLEEIPWHEDESAEYLIDLINKGKIKIGVALDVCSGAGTNTIYLASKGFRVTGIDISETATKIAINREKKQEYQKVVLFFQMIFLKSIFLKIYLILYLIGGAIIIFQRMINQNLHK